MTTTFPYKSCAFPYMESIFIAEAPIQYRCVRLCFNLM